MLCTWIFDRALGILGPARRKEHGFSFAELISIAAWSCNVLHMYEMIVLKQSRTACAAPQGSQMRFHLRCVWLTDYKFWVRRICHTCKLSSASGRKEEASGKFHTQAGFTLERKLPVAYVGALVVRCNWFSRIWVYVTARICWMWLCSGVWLVSKMIFCYCYISDRYEMVVDWDVQAVEPLWMVTWKNFVFHSAFLVLQSEQVYAIYVFPSSVPKENCVIRFTLL